MSNALEQAKRAQEMAALGTKVTIPLSLLESLIAEIERLSRLGNVRDVKDIVMKHTDIRA